MLLDLIPTMLFALLWMAGLSYWFLFTDVYLDFAVFEYVFSILPWGVGLIVCIAVRRRFPQSPRWMRSFLTAVCTAIFFIPTQGPLLALAEEATHRLRLICGTHLNGAFDKFFGGGWCFYLGNSGDNWGSGLAGIWKDTAFSLQAGFSLPSLVGLVLLLFVCFLNDYLIRFFNYIFRTDSP